MKRIRINLHTNSALSASLIALIVLLTLNLNAHFDVAKPKDQADTKSAVQAQYASLPLAFEPNQGQADGGAQFLVHHGQATTYFDGANTTTTVGSDHVTMSLDGASTPNFTGTDQLESKTNYFIGNDHSKWHSDVPNYQQLLAKNVYPGIDLKYYGTNSQLEHDFIVNPGSDYKQIAFHFDGQKDLSPDKDGNLVLKAGESDLRLNAPTTYQKTANTKHTIPSHFELQNSTITVALNEDYDHSQPLVIDPVLIYSTYLGGSGTENGSHFVVDANSNAYLVGYTTSTNFPTSSPFQASNAGGADDVFITKFNPTGSALIYSTYIGGSGDDLGLGIAADLAGNAYITGRTDSANFPAVAAYQSTIGGGQDTYLAKLNPSGSTLLFSTFLGGAANDDGQSLTLDSMGNIYVTGDTNSTNFPTVSAYQSTAPGFGDAFVSKFNNSGSSLLYSTYIGGATSSEQSFGIAVNSAGNAYITGYTNSTDFPTVGAYQSTSGGGTYDAFVTELGVTGSTVVFSTYLGGSGDDKASDIALDTTNNIYVVGQTSSTNYPTASPYQGTYGGSSTDGFLTKFNPSASALVYSTYLGGSGSDIASSLALDSANDVYVIGSTTSTNFPVLNPYQATKAASFDAFVTKFNSSGSSLGYSTFFGGSGLDFGQGIARSLSGNIFISGSTSSTNLPIANAFQATNGGGQDAFVAQFSDNTVVVTGQVTPILTFTISATTCDFGHLSAAQTKSCVHTISAGSNASNGYVISYIPGATLTSGAQTINAMTSQTASVLGTEQFGLNLKANTAAGSHTAANFGANPSGGSGVALANYNTADQFKFVTTGENIAQTTIPSVTTTYTTSYIANITPITEAGLYSTLMTYNIVASY